MTLSSAWSYSSIKAFQTCPKQYYHVRVLRDIPRQPDTEAIIYGKEFHAAAEDFIKHGTKLPEIFSYAQTYLNTLRDMPGDKYCEYEMGLRADFTPCKFKDHDVWARGIADLVCIHDDLARVIDYKTGRSAKYADTAQLELMALCIFKHFPNVKRVKAGLLFVVAREFKPAVYRAEEAPVYWRNWIPLVQRLEGAHLSNTWNPNRSGLCKAHCPVTSCQHNGANKT